MKFRPDIEGLRALAIAPVVIYHAWPSLVPGGFVGVDVFFVISGYLITTLLLQRLAQGRYSVASFYAARIRRIFPALFAMLALVAPAAVLLLDPRALDEFARLLGATTLFASNLELHRTTGYFETAAELKLLVHTWSLAVEEQYYILFPPMLALLWRFWRRGIGWVLALVGLASLLYCLRWMRYDPSLAFYAAPARTFELMLGSGLAWWASGRAGMPVAASAWSQTVGLLGLVGIAASICLMRADLAFPGPAALLPCLATVALIWAGECEGGLATRLLSLRPLRWLGALSFSLYLWHWPVLVLTRHLVLDRPGPGLSVCAVLLAVLLSMASLRWVEGPVRRAPWPQRGMLWLGGCALTFGVSMAGLIHLWARHLEATPGEAAALLAGAQSFSSDRARCHLSGKRELDFERRCVFGAKGVSAELAVWGDSHGVELARAIGDGLPTAGLQERWQVSELTASSCPPAFGFQPPDRPGCLANNEQVLRRLLAEPRVRAVLLVARYEYYRDGADPADFERGLAQTVRQLLVGGKRVLLLDPVPTYRYPVPAALAQRQWRGQDLAGFGQTAAEYRDRQAGALAQLAALESFPQVQRVSMAQALCGERCRVLDAQGRPLYFDDNHLGMPGAALLAPEVLRRLP